MYIKLREGSRHGGMGGTEGSGDEFDANKLHVHMKVPNNKIKVEKPLQPPLIALSLW